MVMATTTAAGRTFRREIKKLGMTGNEIANLYNVDPSTISYWMRYGVSKKHAENVATSLNVTPEAIQSAGKLGRPKQVPVTDPVPQSSMPEKRLRPDLVVRLASTALTEEQAQVLAALINNYSEAA